MKDLLKGVDLFSNLDDMHLEVISKSSQTYNYDKGDLILHEEDQEDRSLYIISSGSVKVFLTGLDGKEAILAILKDGDFFGEMALLDGDPRSASVKVLEKTILMVIKQEDFYDILKRFPEMASGLLKEMSKRLRKANRQISSLALMSVYGRVASTLKQLMEEQGIRMKLKDGSFSIVIHNRPSHQQLADMSGTTRETISRVLAHFQKKGCLAIDGRDLFILEESSLILEAQ